MIPATRRSAARLRRSCTRRGVNFAILGDEETCTGDSARRAGNEYLFQQLAQQNIETLKRYKFKLILTQCPHCFNTLLNEYPQFGGNLPGDAPHPVHRGAAGRGADQG